MCRLCRAPGYRLCRAPGAPTSRTPGAPTSRAPGRRHSYELMVQTWIFAYALLIYHHVYIGSLQSRQTDNQSSHFSNTFNTIEACFVLAIHTSIHTRKSPQAQRPLELPRLAYFLETAARFPKGYSQRAYMRGKASDCLQLLQNDAVIAPISYILSDI